MPTEQQIQIAQGALFLIDNIGPPPRGVDFRLFTNQAIGDHLKQHSYYYQPRRPRNQSENRTLVTTLWMRQFFRTLYKKANRGFYGRRLLGDDHTDTLLRKGSTEGFPENVLDLYNYNRATFLESDLPAYDAKTVDSESIDAAATSTGAVGKQTADEEHIANSRRRRTSVESSSAAARPLSYNVRSSVEQFEATEKSDDGISGGHNDRDFNNDKDDSSYVDDIDRVDHPREDEPEILDESEATVAEDAQTSSKLPSRQSDSASTDKSRIASNAASRTTAPGEVDGAISGTRRSFVANILRGFKFDIKSQTFAKDPANEVSRNKNDDPSDESKRKPSLDTAMARLGKRKRGRNEAFTEASPTEDELVIEPNKRRASNTAMSRGSRAGPPSRLQPAVANMPVTASELGSDMLAPTPSPITPRAELSKDVQSVEGEIRDSQPPQDELISPNIRPQDQPAGMQDNESKLNNAKLHEILIPATREIIARIGDIKTCLSFLDEDPSDRLEALYIRCWGPNWKGVHSKLTKARVVIVEEVTMCLIAAYIFDNVLNQGASIADVRAKQLELKGPAGRAVLRILDLESKEHEFCQVIRTIEREDARVMLAQDHTSIANQLHSEAQTFTMDLWEIIRPHLCSLSILARGHGLASGLNERSWQETFERNITELIEAVLRYRLELLASGCDHVHTWPETDEAYDLSSMEIYGMNKKLPLQVLFTVFPGTVSKQSDATRMEAKQEAKAKVRVQKR